MSRTPVYRTYCDRCAMPEPCTCEERGIDPEITAVPGQEQARTKMRRQEAQIDLSIRRCESCPFLSVISWPVKLSSDVDDDMMQPGYYCIHAVNRGRPGRMLIALQDEIDAEGVGSGGLTDFLVATREGSPFPENCPLDVKDLPDHPPKERLVEI